jgi:outer membrane protein assembly factor BamB
MSAIQASTPVPSPAPKPAAAPTRRHRFWFPLLVLFLLVCAFATPIVLEEFELVPEQRQVIGMYVEMFGVLGSVALLLVWWLFLSGFSWTTKLSVVVLLGMAVGGLIYSVRDVELVLVGNYYLRPKLKFKWVQTPDEALAAHRAALPKIDLPPVDLTIGPSDFPCYRGRDGDGIARGGPDLALDWSKSGPRVVYRQPCLGGYASFALAGNVAITAEQRSKDDQVLGLVVCYDRATGRERWAYDQLGVYKDKSKMGDGPRATPAVDDQGRVFAVGAGGLLVCLDGTTGKELWKIDVLKDAGATNTIWGLSCSPLVVGDVVVVNPGSGSGESAGRAVCAYDRKTGTRVWAAGDHKAGYSSPRLAKLGGVPQILIFDADGLAGLDPANKGKELWRFTWKTFSDMNDVQPLVYGDDRVFISSELANGCAMVRVKKGADGEWKAEEVWAHKRFWAKFSNPVIVGVAIFGLSGGDLYSLDAESGKVFWKERGHGRFGQGQVIAAGDRLLVQSDEGTIYYVAAETLAFKELGHLKVLEKQETTESEPKTWNTPALAGTQLFLRDNEKQMACVELPAAK